MNAPGRRHSSQHSSLAQTASAAISLARDSFVNEKPVDCSSLKCEKLASKICTRFSVNTICCLRVFFDRRRYEIRITLPTLFGSHFHTRAPFQSDCTRFWCKQILPAPPSVASPSLTNWKFSPILCCIVYPNIERTLSPCVRSPYGNTTTSRTCRSGPRFSQDKQLSRERAKSTNKRLNVDTSQSLRVFRVNSCICVTRT